MKLHLPNVTLAGVDCLNVRRLVDVSKICQKHVQFGAVKILTSQGHPDPNIVKIPHQTYEQISKFLIKDLNSYVETDYVLIIEHDGFILNAAAWTDLFFKYDYIGAPWWYTDGYNVGNGGFSLRSKKLCEILANDSGITRFHGEDHHICRTYRKRLENQGIRFAPECVARKFSCEGNHRTGLKWNGQFGFHHYVMTNLDNWSVFSNANWFTDFRFILRFLRKKRERLSIKLSKTIIQEFCGTYSQNGKESILHVENIRGTLYVNGLHSKTQFNNFDESFFFSDSTEQILEFRVYREKQVMILYQRGMKDLYESSYYRKITD